jgi:hypothetical protein
VFGIFTSESTQKQEKRGNWLAAYQSPSPEREKNEKKNGGFKTAIRLRF